MKWKKTYTPRSLLLIHPFCSPRWDDFLPKQRTNQHRLRTTTLAYMCEREQACGDLPTFRWRSLPWPSSRWCALLFTFPRRRGIIICITLRPFLLPLLLNGWFGFYVLPKLSRFACFHRHLPVSSMAHHSASIPDVPACVCMCVYCPLGDLNWLFNWYSFALARFVGLWCTDRRAN